MSDTSARTLDPSDSAGLAEHLQRIDQRIPAGPWTLWTSCSFRRIGGPEGKDGDVLSAYRQRSDGHPDLSMPEDQLAELVELRNALPELIEHLNLLRSKLSLHNEKLPTPKPRDRGAEAANGEMEP